MKDQFPPLESVNTPTMNTRMAAHYLGRAPKTLLEWSASGRGPVQPRRIGARLGWPVARVKELCGLVEEDARHE